MTLTIGFQTTQFRSHDIGLQPYLKQAKQAKQAEQAEQAEQAKQEGKGFIDTVRSIISNNVSASDSNARPRFPGEHHAILRLPNGKFGVANYMGPGTQVIKRIKRGDPPRTVSDKVAQAHDLRYTLHPEKEREADEMMISKLKDAQRNKEDSFINIQTGMKPIQAKIFAENTGLLKKGKFTSPTPMSTTEKSMLSSKLSELQQEGFGGKPGKPERPGDALKLQLLKELTQKPQKPLKQVGAGVVHDFLIHKVIPHISKELGIQHLSLQKVLKAIPRFSGPLTKVVPMIAKRIMGLLGVGGTIGRGVMDSLIDNLGNALFRTFKALFVRRQKSWKGRQGQQGKGIGLSGGSLKSIFASFVKVMKPVWKVAKKVIPVVAPLLL